MKNEKNWLTFVASIFLIFLCFSITAITDLPENHLFVFANDTEIQDSDISVQEENKTNVFPVVLEENTLFTFSETVAGISPDFRAKRAKQRILKIARDYSIPVDKIKVISYDTLRILAADDEMIFAFAQPDAKAQNKQLDQLANETLKKIKNAIIQYREERKLKVLIRGILYALIATIVFLICIKLINYIYHQLYEKRNIFLHSLRIQRFEILSVNQQAKIFLISLKLIRFIVIVFLLSLYITTVLNFFPWTDQFGDTAINSLLNALAFVWQNLLGYLPNLFIISIIIFITYYTIQLCKIFFRELEGGNISIPGFYQEWAQPTYKLIFLLILAIAASIIFSYLPGSKSPAFRGISILIGALVTFGGASTIANIISGFILIYTRAFQIGDRIKIENFTGNVVEKTVLSTRIRTHNNEIVTIPNSSLITSSIINYSAVLRETNKPVILYTTITLSYDLSWRQVHKTLIEAALTTPEILHEPPPAVWQTSLDDFYVSYELRAYTKKPTKMGEIYSHLHQNI